MRIIYFINFVKMINGKKYIFLIKNKEIYQIFNKCVFIIKKIKILFFLKIPYVVKELKMDLLL